MTTPTQPAPPATAAPGGTGRRAVLAIGGIILAAAIYNAGAQTAAEPAPAVTVTRTITTAALPAASATSTGPATSTLSGGGALLVPTEAKPGTWRTTVPDGEHCYWARLAGFTGDTDDILSNGSGDAGERVTVTIKATDRGFEFSPGCGTWTRIG